MYCVCDKVLCALVHHIYICTVHIWMCRGVRIYGKINIFIFLQNVCAHSFWNAFNFYLDDIAQANSLGNSQQYLDIYLFVFDKGNVNFLMILLLCMHTFVHVIFFFCWRVTTLSPRILKSNTIYDFLACTIWTSFINYKSNNIT